VVSLTSFILEMDIPLFAAAIANESTTFLTSNADITLAGCRSRYLDLVSLKGNLEELRDFLKRSLQVLGGAEKFHKLLRVHDLSCNDTIRLAVRPNTHVSCVHFHGVQHTGDDHWIDHWIFDLLIRIEAERLRLRRDQINLRLEIVAKADDSRTAFLRPCVGYAAQLVGIQTALIELCLDVRVDCIIEVELELTI
jgi:hypothetical protein